ncbi:MAG: SIS domain-containing protein [Clostridia bacterium]|nr:SIS domain-containing protein [Clostridia bacterium]
MDGRDYINIVAKTVKASYEEQTDAVAAASECLAKTVEDKNNVFVFGCSHAGIIAEEVFYRTGGLAVINPIFFPAMMLNTRPVTMTSSLERVAGIGKIIFEKNSIKKGDLLIIHSVSGRNTVPVEMAITAKENGVKTVCITNLDYSKAVTSRHPSGKRLFEVCDIVLDNKGEVGDAAVTVEGLPEKIGPTSTAVGTALINAIVIDAVNKMIKDGTVPPVLMSANLDGGDEHNAAIFKEYKDNIFYM